MRFRQILPFIFITIASAVAVPQAPTEDLLTKACKDIGGRIVCCSAFGPLGLACQKFSERESTPHPALSSELTRATSSHNPGGMPLR